jgi:hypothetical protein
MSPTFYRLNAEGTPVPCAVGEVDWHPDARRVGLTTVKVGRRSVDVSTVFLALDHNFTNVGPPMLYETMIFGASRGALRDYCRRYATRAEAEAGHTKAVALARRLLEKSAR